MKPTSINVQVTKSPKQYEAIRLGIEASLDAGETVESAIKAATAQLNALYAEMYAPGAKAPQNAEKPATNAPQAAVPQPAPAPAPAPATKKAKEPIEREPLAFEDPRVQQVVTRMEKNPAKKEEIYKNALKYFLPDANALKAWDVALALA